MMPLLSQATGLLLQSPLACPCVAWDEEQPSAGRSQGEAAATPRSITMGVPVKDDSCHFAGYTLCSICDETPAYCDEYVSEREYTSSGGNGRRCCPPTGCEILNSIPVPCVRRALCVCKLMQQTKERNEHESFYHERYRTGALHG